MSQKTAFFQMIAHPPTTLAATVFTIAIFGAAARPADAAAATSPDSAPLREPPDWAVIEPPREFRAFVGKNALPDPYPQWTRPIGVGTQGIDFWQANHFIVYRSETAKFLYERYTPTTVHYNYKAGTLPAFERIVDRHLSSITGDRNKAIVLVREVMPRLMKHPGMAPLGPACPTDRGLLDEPLLASGQGLCNEQARVFVRLCQVAGIPARLIFLFYSNKKNGHVVAEFYADGRWSMADASYFCVFPAEDGRLMSAAECHEGRLLAGRTYYHRMRELLAMPDEELVGAKFAHVEDAAERRKLIFEEAAGVHRLLGSRTPESIAAEFWVFGVLNYPLPARASD
jgi:hypothetical protein